MEKALKRALGRPSKSSAEALTASVLEAASNVFLSKGFSASTMRQIAEEAKITPQTLYARFSDKAQLFEALMKTRTDVLLNAMSHPFQEYTHPREALESFGINLLTTFLGTDLQKLHRMVIGEVNTFPELAVTFFKAGPGRGRSLLIAYLRKCVEHEQLHIDQIEIAAEQFIGSLVGGIVIGATLAQKATIRSASEIANWVHLAVEVFLKAYGNEKNYEGC